MADPIAYVGAVTGIASLAVSLWTRVAQQTYWRDEPIRNRQRELRIQVLNDARLVLDDIEESLKISKSRQAASLDTSASRTLQAWHLQHKHRFASQTIPGLILERMPALTKWESDAFEYSHTSRDLEWSLEMKEKLAEEGKTGMSGSWMDGLTVDEAVNTHRDARNAAAFRLEQSSEVARTDIVDLIRRLERMDLKHE